jgi:hypothetical protein
MKMKQIDYQASQFIALQVGAHLLTSLVGMYDEAIKMGYVDFSPSSSFLKQTFHAWFTRMFKQPPLMCHGCYALLCL